MTNNATEPGPIEGIHAGNVTTWLRERVPALDAPLRFELIAGGRSNLTFKVTDAKDRSWVLRRPPLGHVLATAHDMGREHRIISALAPTDVPVAPAVGLCTDEAVNGSPFYVMDYVEGLVLRDREAAKQLSLEARKHASESLVDVMGRIHAVNPDEVGLGDLGRKDGYITRQLKRWHRQWESSAVADLTIIDEVHSTLSAHVPRQQGVSIVHGDYRLDNTMLNADGDVIAVLDWEICTLGDPLADVGLLMVYWTEPDDAWSPLLVAPTSAPGFASRAEVLDRYAAASDLDLSSIDFYTAFGYWKLACILAGVYTRYAAGAMGGDRTGTEGYADQVRTLAETAREVAERITS